MNSYPEPIEGGLTAPTGFFAGATYTGIRNYGPQPRFDLGVLFSEQLATVAGMFTRNAVVGAPLLLTRERVSGGVARAIVVNSGNANVATGTAGADDAQRMAELTAAHLGIDPTEVLVGSTGVIGRRLDMDRIESGIAEIEMDRKGGPKFARAMMTTDTRAKERAVRLEVDGHTYIVGGAAKGAGMIHPDMATMFGFLTTDAPASPKWLHGTLQAVVNRSFNMIDVDMDTSTSDMVIVLANGVAGGETIDMGHPAAEPLALAIETISIELARELARDGEGARTLIEVVVEGAASKDDARRTARTISSSPLIKTMVTGRDPNWGRVLMAAGRSGATIKFEDVRVWIGEHCTFEHSEPTAIVEEEVSAAMDREEVQIRIDLGIGEARATAWGCDLTEEYVRINSDYTT
jgi:glutamate N-acetyltransferase/amino-acid N-acetyltransferase